MAIRKLPDGSMLDTDTGALIGGDPAREAAARRISEATGGYRAPVRNKGQQVMDVNVVDGKHMIAPVNNLAISPYSAMGDDVAAAAIPATVVKPPMSDGMKRMLLVGGIVAAAYGITWLNGKMKSKGKK